MKSLSDVIAAFPAEVRTRYDFRRAVYSGALSRITGLVCPEHGEFSQYAAQLRKGAGCPSCGAQVRVSKRRMSPEQFFADCAEKHNSTYDYSDSTYVRMSDKITARCPTHGLFQITALKHYYEAQGCGACEADAKRTRILSFRHLSPAAKVANTGDTFFERCSARHAGLYAYPEQTYDGAKALITAVCPQHGPFQQRAWKHLNGAGCPHCGQRSAQEDVIAAFLGQYTTVVRRDRTVLAPKELDLWLPEKGVGVEYHGLHWHTFDRVGYVHRDKWRMANERGVRLVQVFEDEWLSNQDVVKSRLLAIIGVAPKAHARKLDLRPVDTAAARAFLVAHHTQGAGGGGGGGVAYGLYDGQQLMAVATFGPARGGAMVGGSTSVWEVYRYASEGVVVGGFGRLFAAFRKEHQPERVISFCDLRYGTGALYAATGFELESITAPDYWWVPNGRVQRVPRYQTQKHKLSTHPVLKAFYAPGLSEARICAAAGWRKIYGVGNQKWGWTSSTRT
jgi:hypothetical protein